MNLTDLMILGAATQPGAGGEGQGNPIVAFLPLILMFVIFYFLLIRPQQKRQKEHKLMVSNLKKGDKVVTNGGIIGKVLGVDEKKVVVKVGEDEVKLEFEKSAVSQVVQQD